MNEFFFNNNKEITRKIEKYNTFVSIDCILGNYPLLKCKQTKNNNVIVWRSNDYPSISQNTSVVGFISETIDKFGMGAGGSRNIGGTSSLTCELEKNIADWLKTESALIFPTGFSSNDATLQCLIRLLDDLVVFSDENNHASIINALRQSGAKREIFKHNGLQYLIKLLQEYPKKLIVLLSIHSMDSYIAPLSDVTPIKGIVAAAKECGSFTFLYEIHTIGMCELDGCNISGELGFNSETEILQITMAKDLGSIGGFIAMENVFVDAICFFYLEFVFTTALPPASIAAGTIGIKIIRSSSNQRETLQIQTPEPHRALMNNSLPVMHHSTTNVSPLLVSDTGNFETLK